MVLDVVLGTVIGKAIDIGADALFKEPEVSLELAALGLGRAKEGAMDIGADSLIKEPKPEPKSNVGTLLTGAALAIGGLAVAGMIAGSSDEKESQKAAGQISTGKNKVKK